MADQQLLDRLDQETTERICRAAQEAGYEMRRARRALRDRVRAAVAEHRKRVADAAAPRRRQPREEVDYARLYEILERQPLTYDIIKQVTGLKDSGVAQVITTLSLDYPLWNPAKGIYERLR